MSSWIYTASAAAMLCAVCIALVPEGKVGKALKLVCGLVMTAAVLSPLVEIDMEEYSISAARYKLEAENILNAAEQREEVLNRRIIEEKYSAYILDKASNCEISLREANVTVSWCSDGYWYPIEVELVTCDGAYRGDSTSLEAIIEADLGVPKERQIWRSENAEAN